MPEERGGGWNGEGGREEREEEEGKNYTRHWLVGHLEMHHFISSVSDVTTFGMRGKRDISRFRSNRFLLSRGIFLKGMNDESAGGGFSPSIPLGVGVCSPGSFGALSRACYRMGQLLIRILNNRTIL